VNLIFTVGLIRYISGQGWLPDFTLLGRFARQAGLVNLRQLFVHSCHEWRLPGAAGCVSLKADHFNESRMTRR
jgi:hypothetical protein